MRKNIFYGFILLLSLDACTHSNRYKYEYYDDGTIRIKYQINRIGEPDGVMWRYYKNNKLKFVDTIENISVINSYHLGYYPNGKLMEEGKYLKNKRIGWWKFYDSLGHLLYKEQYVVVKDSEITSQNPILQKENGVNQRIYFFKNGEIDYDKSQFFEFQLGDTLMLGENKGYIITHIPKDTTILGKISVLILKTKDTFHAWSNQIPFVININKKGEQCIDGKIIAGNVISDSISKDMDTRKLVRYHFMFSKKVYVKDTLK